jgi:hypothetical protein
MKIASIFDEVQIPTKKINLKNGDNNFEQYIMKRKSIEVMCEKDFLKNFKIRENDLLFSNRQNLFEKIQDYVHLKEMIKNSKNKTIGDQVNLNESKEKK